MATAPPAKKKKPPPQLLSDSKNSEEEPIAAAGEKKKNVTKKKKLLSYSKNPEEEPIAAAGEKKKKKTRNEIDEIFQGKKARKSKASASEEEVPEKGKKQDVGTGEGGSSKKPKDKRKKRREAALDEGPEAQARRRKTSEGLAVYSAEELGWGNPNAGGEGERAVRIDDTILNHPVGRKVSHMTRAMGRRNKQLSPGRPQIQQKKFNLPIHVMQP